MARPARDDVRARYRQRYEAFLARRARRRGSYATRVLVGLATSLAIMIAAVHLPLHTSPDYVRWFVRHVEEHVTLEAVEVAQHERARPAVEVPVTLHEPQTAEPENEPGDGEAEGASEPVLMPEPQEAGADRDAPGHMQVATFAEIMPKVRGGLRNYYIHIDYPPEARAQGIQGRLVLSFVVETDGTTSGIEVEQSLHPLCDSAAVQALRKTYFVPALQNGEPTRVRMRLPVRFRLLKQPDAETPASAPRE